MTLPASILTAVTWSYDYDYSFGYDEEPGILGVASAEDVPAITITFHIKLTLIDASVVDLRKDIPLEVADVIDGEIDNILIVDVVDNGDGDYTITLAFLDSAEAAKFQAFYACFESDTTLASCSTEFNINGAAYLLTIDTAQGYTTASVSLTVYTCNDGSRTGNSETCYDDAGSAATLTVGFTALVTAFTSFYLL